MLVDMFVLIFVQVDKRLHIFPSYSMLFFDLGKSVVGLFIFILTFMLSFLYLAYFLFESLFSLNFDSLLELQYL